MSDAARAAWFAATRAVLREYYLADPANQYQQSGRSSGRQRWEATRRCIADGVDRSGSFLDVGCANGLLLESVAEWVAERALTITPYGLDFIEELVALARRRIPGGTFWVGNAWDWEPPRRFTFVRTNLEYVPVADRTEMVRRHLDWVEPGGRLIVCHYPDRGADPVDVGAFLTAAGHEVGGVLSGLDRGAAWIDVAPRFH